MNFREEIQEVLEPYIYNIDPIYGPEGDYEGCKVLENYLAKVCRQNDIMCNVSYLDYGVGSKRIKGVMTITIVQHYDVVEIYTYIYERKNDIG